MLYTIGNRLTDDMPHFLYLLANVHIFSDIYTNCGHLFYFSPYFFIFRYSVAGLTFSIAAACSLCPLQALRALTMFFFSNDSSFNGRTAGTDACALSQGGIPLSKPSISSIGSSETSTERLILFCSSRTLPGHG